MWEKVHLDRLKQLGKAKLSANEVAKRLNVEFNTSYTRSAVISVTHRSKDPELNGLFSARWSASPANRAKAKRPSVAPRPPRNNLPPRGSAYKRSVAAPWSVKRPFIQHVPEPNPDPGPPDELPDGGGVSFMDLSADMCRWPYGESGNMRFCGGVVAARGEIYCAAHKRRQHR